MFKANFTFELELLLESAKNDPRLIILYCTVLCFLVNEK
jgi:hypothetical protein